MFCQTSTLHRPCRLHPGIVSELLESEKPSYLTAKGTGVVAVTLQGKARKLIRPDYGLVECTTLDEGKEEELDFSDLRCVVIGRDKVQGTSREAKYHTLIIRKVSNATTSNTYERTGVASLNVRYVADEGEWVSIQ